MALNQTNYLLTFKKTHNIMFHRTRIKNKAAEDRMHLCGNNLLSVSNTKFLGVIIDSKLNWPYHITYIKKIKIHWNFKLK